MNRIRIGSRDSKLAMIQTQMVADAIRVSLPETEIEIVALKTTGDKILDRTLEEVGGKGLFVKELDEALLAGKVDITVHSYKDMPMEINPELPVVALSLREDSRDVLILPKNKTAEAVPVGCASRRRSLQLKELFSGCETAPVRGNVQTRMRKLDSGAYSALVLAAAGIKRLELTDRISRFFTPDEILPSACQGIIAVQGRRGENYSYLDSFNSTESWIVSRAERGFVKQLNGGCSAPIAAYAEVSGSEVRLRGMYYNEETEQIIKGEICGAAEQAEQLGIELAMRLKG